MQLCYMNEWWWKTLIKLRQLTLLSYIYQISAKSSQYFEYKLRVDLDVTYILQSSTWEFVWFSNFHG